MTKKGLFLSIILLPVVLLLAAYLAWPLWITPLARALLADTDVELVSAQISRPGWQQLVIDELKLSYAAQDYNVLVTVPQLSLNYVWQGLLDGQLHRLHIPAAQLRLKAQKNAPSPSADEPLQIAELLPSVLFPQLPVADLQVEQLSVSLPEELGFGDLSGNLHFNSGQLQLQLASLATLKEQQENLSGLEFGFEFEVKLRVDDRNHLQLDLKHNAEPVIDASSQIIDGQLNGELTVDLTSAAVLLKQLELLSADDQLTGQAALQWQLPVPEEVASDDWAMTADFQSQLTVDSFKQKDISARSITFSSVGQAQLSGDIIRLQFEAGSALQMSQLKAADMHMKKLAATLPHAFDVVLQPERLSLPELEIALPATQIYWQQEAYRFKSSRIKLTELAVDLQNPEQLSSAIELSLTGLDFDSGDLQIKPLNVQGDWQLGKNQLKGKVRLSDSAGVMQIRGAMTHNLASGTGQLTAQLDKLSFNKTQSYLPRLFRNWSHPFDLFAGELAMNSRVKWHEAQLDVQGQLTLGNIGGFYDSNLFRGLNTEISFSGPLDNPVIVAEKLTVSSVDVGVPIKNIQFALHATAKAAQIKNFQAELLGGQVGQRLIRYDFTQDNNELLLQIRGIQLAQLVSLETGVEGLGILDGELPIRISATGISVPQGEIKARSPGGYIKYQGAKSMGAAVADMGVGFALEALENFHYELLDAKASYSEDGQLKLATTLQGRNPDMSEQRPVHYNITIQENIPVLIESLKLTQQISDDIERRIQAFYKK